MGALHKDHYTFFFNHISLSSSQNEKYFRQKLQRKSKHILFSENFFFFGNRAAYELMWNTTVQPNRPQMTLWRMRNACWINKAADTHSEYVIRTSFSLQQWLHERTSILRYTYIICLLDFKLSPCFESIMYSFGCFPGV